MKVLMVACSNKGPKDEMMENAMMEIHRVDVARKYRPRNPRTVCPVYTSLGKRGKIESTTQGYP